jgi:hypothetical protein
MSDYTCLDCGFASVRPHVSHFDDCGCLSRRYQERIANLIADRRLLMGRLAEAEESNEGLLLKITDLMRERNRLLRDYTTSERERKALDELAELKARRCGTCLFSEICLAHVDSTEGLFPVESCSRWTPQP